jgi:YVTN family beta-propeller protein
VVALAAGAGDFRSPESPPTASRPTAAGGTGVIRVVPSTGQVQAGPSFPAVNGIADGLGSVWLTGAAPGQAHLLYAVDPATGRLNATVTLPSISVLNPNDIAVGSGAVWVAVGASVYRIGPGTTLAGNRVTRAFAALPRDGFIGDIAVGAGAVWVTDTTHGKVYRFAASTGRLEAVVPVGATAGAMAVGDGGVWVANGDARTVSRISVVRNRVGLVVKVPGVPSHMTAAESGLWVTDGTGSVMTLPEGTSGRVLTVPVGGEATGVAASGGTVWVSSTTNGTLSRIDARQRAVVARVHVGVRPYAVAADWRSVWVSVLGRPVMMRALPGGSATSAAQLAWLQRFCG